MRQTRGNAASAGVIEALRARSDLDMLAEPAQPTPRSIFEGEPETVMGALVAGVAPSLSTPARGEA